MAWYNIPQLQIYRFILCMLKILHQFLYHFLILFIILWMNNNTTTNNNNTENWKYLLALTHFLLGLNGNHNEYHFVIQWFSSFLLWVDLVTGRKRWVHKRRVNTNTTTDKSNKQRTRTWSRNAITRDTQLSIYSLRLHMMLPGDLCRLRPVITHCLGLSGVSLAALCGTVGNINRVGGRSAPTSFTVNTSMMRFDLKLCLWQKKQQRQALEDQEFRG